MSHHSHRESPNVGDEPITSILPSVDDKSFSSWRLRRRKLVPLACIAFILSLLLFFRELLSSPKDVEQLKFVQPPSFVTNTDIPTSTTITAPTATNTDIVHHDEEPVVFVFIIWSEPSAVEGALLIKVSPLVILRNRLISLTNISPYSCTTLIHLKYTSYATTPLTNICRHGYLWSIARPAMFACCSINLPGRVCWIESNEKVLLKQTIRQDCVRLHTG